MVDNNLHLLIGIKETYMTSFSKVRKPFKSDQPYVGNCLLGWVPYGRDRYLKSDTLIKCNYIRIEESCAENITDKPVDLSCDTSVGGGCLMRVSLLIYLQLSYLVL